MDVVIICDSINYHYLCRYETTLGLYKAIFCQGEELYFTCVYNALCGIFYAVVYCKAQL